MLIQGRSMVNIKANLGRKSNQLQAALLDYLSIEIPKVLKVEITENVNQGKVPLI